MDGKLLLIYALKLHLYTARCLQNLSIYNINFEIWQQKTFSTLQSLFGYNSSRAKEYMDIIYSPRKMQEKHIHTDEQSMYQTGLKKAIDLLEESICIITGEERDNYNSNMFCFIEDMIKETAASESGKEALLVKLNKIKTSWIKEKDNKNSIEVQNNRLATFLNKIIMENEEEVCYGADIFKAK